MTHAILLAAGSGTRLRPYTDEKPKCMVPYAGHPLIHHQLNALRRNGVTGITVVGGYKYQCLEQLGVKLIVNEHYATTNMVSTLFCARDYIRDDTLICYTDIVYQDRLITTLLKSNSDISVLYDLDWRSQWEARMDNPLDDAETFKLDDSHRITEIGQKPRGFEDIEGQYIGLIRLNGNGAETFTQFYDQLDPDALYEGRSIDNMYMTTLLQLMINAGLEIHGVPVSGGWLEFDHPSDLALPLNLP